MLIKEIMTREVVVLEPDETIKAAVERFALESISGAPVVDEEGRIVGILSEKDIIQALETKCKRLEMVYPSLSMVSVSFVECFDDKEVVDAFTEIANTSVGQLMKKRTYTVDEDDKLGDAIDLMNKKTINRVPVMKDGRVVGIVTRKDIIKGLAKTTN